MGRILLSICAVVVALGLAGSSPPNQGAAEQDNQADQPQQQAATPTPAPQANDRDALNAACQQGEADRQSDLCAQWYAADSAKESAVWTRLTGVFTGLGLIVGAATMVAAIFAALFAKLAANHAWAGVCSGRAWVVPIHSAERSYLSNSMVFGEHFTGQALQVQTTNVGATVANSVRVSAGQLFLLKGESLPDSLPLGRINDAGIIAPGSSGAGAVLYISDERRDQLKAREVRGFVFYRITYRDVFFPDLERETRACFEVEWKGTKTDGNRDWDNWAANFLNEHTLAT